VGDLLVQSPRSPDTRRVDNRKSRQTRIFTHWSVVLAVVLLVCNDWWLKSRGRFPVVSGKASDFAGLFLLPLVIATGIEFVSHKALKPKTFVCVLGLSGLTFSLMKTNQTISGVIGRIWGLLLAPERMIRGVDCCRPVEFIHDRTDILALCVLPLTYLVWRSHAPDRSSIRD